MISVDMRDEPFIFFEPENTQTITHFARHVSSQPYANEA